MKIIIGLVIPHLSSICPNESPPHLTSHLITHLLHIGNQPQYTCALQSVLPHLPDCLCSLSFPEASLLSLPLRLTLLDFPVTAIFQNSVKVGLHLSPLSCARFLNPSHFY